MNLLDGELSDGRFTSAAGSFTTQKTRFATRRRCRRTP